MSVPLTGQVNPVSGVAQALSATQVPCVAFTIKAPASNAKPVFIGGSGVTSTTGHQLDPGDTIDYELKFQNGQPTYQLRPSDFWVIGTSPDIVTFLASPV